MSLSQVLVLPLQRSSGLLWVLKEVAEEDWKDEGLLHSEGDEDTKKC